MKTLTKVAAVAALLLGFVLPAAAGAQTYPSPDTPELPTTTTVPGDELPSETEQPPSGGGDTGAPGGAEEEPGEVLPSDTEQTAGAAAGAETAPSGSLPITGGDVVGLALLGGAAIAIGGAMVVRSRRAGSSEA